MLALDLRILVVAPFALAEAFLLWTLWHFLGQSFKKRSRVPTRLVSIAQSSAPTAAARLFSFPESSKAGPATQGAESGPRPELQPVGPASFSPERLARVASR